MKRVKWTDTVSNEKILNQMNTSGHNYKELILSRLNKEQLITNAILNI